MLYTPDEQWVQKNQDVILKQRTKEVTIDPKELEDLQKKEKEITKQLTQKLKQQTTDPKYVRGVVKFSNISVRNLPKQENAGLDPFVLFRMGNEEKETSIAKNVTNYDYKNEQYEVTFDPEKMNGRTEIEVYNYDSVNGNSLIGVTSVDILPSYNKKMQVELFLKQKLEQADVSYSQLSLSLLQSTQKQGKVIFRMIYIPEEDWIKQNQDELAKRKKDLEELEKHQEEQDAKYVKGNVKLSNISVNNLPNTNATNKNVDPFVVFQIGEEWKETTIAKNSQNYFYQHEEYDIRYDPARVKGTKDLFVQVFDYDEITGNDLIGIASVDILPSLNKQILIELFLQPLKDKKDTQQFRTNLTSQLKDEGFGKVTFWMQYTPDVQISEEEQINQIKKKQEREMNLQIEEMKKQNEKVNTLRNRLQRLDLEDQENQKKEAEQAQYNKGIIKISNISVNNLKEYVGLAKLLPFVNFKMGSVSLQT
ncbi:MAG: hypothetical protein EZS28_041116, partial [Streblomastix strix]